MKKWHLERAARHAGRHYTISLRRGSSSLKQKYTPHLSAAAATIQQRARLLKAQPRTPPADARESAMRCICHACLRYAIWHAALFTDAYRHADRRLFYDMIADIDLPRCCHAALPRDD